MAIVQIARITHRKGLMENLPQLAGGEFGWALDDQRLWIGNGTLSEGAPLIGNTEILTQHSDILGLASTYNYKGEVENPNNPEFKALAPVQTGVTVNSPVYRSLQAKLDEFVSVKDFGAVGDGVTDDTDAINRALYQLFCVGANEETRRSLFFPAGLYLISGTLKIPPYAKLWGEGIESSVIHYETSGIVDEYVVVTSDSLHQVGANIAQNSGAIPPQGIEFSSLTISTAHPNSLLLLDKTKQSYFDSVNFRGAIDLNEVEYQTKLADLFDDEADYTSAVTIVSTIPHETQHITFDKCRITGIKYGFFCKYNARGITISNCSFNTHVYGVVLGDYEDNDSENGGPQGVRVVQNIFDRVYREGVIVTQCDNHFTGFNLFLDVGNHCNGFENPESPIVNFQTDNNLSWGDLFNRSDDNNKIIPRVELNNNQCIATDSTGQLKLGQFHKTVGKSIRYPNDLVSQELLYSIPTNQIRGFEVHYNIIKGENTRTGKVVVSCVYTPNTTDPVFSYTDEYIETDLINLPITVIQTGTDANGLSEIRVYVNLDGNSETTDITYTVDKFTYQPGTNPI